MRATFGLVVVLVLGCGGVSAVEPDADGGAGSSGGTLGAAAGTSGGAGASSAGTTGSAGTSGAAGTGSAGGGAGVTGAAGAAAGSTGSAGTGGAVAMCVHVNGPIVVTGLCPGKAACSKTCSCSGGYGSSIQTCMTNGAQIDAQLPCSVTAGYIGDQPGAAARTPPYSSGFCNRAGSLCTGAPSMLCVSDCAECP